MPAWRRQAAAPLLVVHDGPSYDREAGLTAYLQGARRPGRAAAAAGRAAAGGAARPLVLRQPRLRRRPRPGGAAAPDRALAHDAAGRHRREPRRARRGCTPSRSYPEVVRRAVPAVRQLLPARDGPAGERLQRVPGDRRASWRPCAAGRRPARPVPTVITCGADEENLANNRRMARVAAPPRVPGALRGRPAAATTTSRWRDAFDPHLPDLLRAACR